MGYFWSPPLLARVPSDEAGRRQRVHDVRALVAGEVRAYRGGAVRKKGLVEERVPRAGVHARLGGGQDAVASFRWLKYMRIVNTCSETNEEVDVKEALPL